MKRKSRHKLYGMHKVGLPQYIAQIVLTLSFPMKWGLDSVVCVMPAIGPLDGCFCFSRKGDVYGDQGPYFSQYLLHNKTTHTHTPHILNCTQIHTNLTVLDLWTTPVNAIHFWFVHIIF